MNEQTLGIIDIIAALILFAVMIWVLNDGGDKVNDRLQFFLATPPLIYLGVRRIAAQFKAARKLVDDNWKG